MTVSPDAALKDVLKHPGARDVFERYLPGFMDTPTGQRVGNFPVGMIVRSSPALAEDPGAAEVVLAELDAAIVGDVPAMATDRAPGRAADPSYEADGIPIGSAGAAPPVSATVWRPAELLLSGPSHGNPFVDVDVRARFQLGATVIDMGGFYDGDGRYIVRFLPDAAGDWSYTTTSTARSLDGLRGTFLVTDGDAGHGPVEVRDTFHFGYRGGGRYIPLGTTAYVWNHQPDALEELTLATLAASPFTKIRMCVFPKSYLYNENEPRWYPFEGDPESGFDFERLVPEYFRHLEERITDLDRLGIEADLILFHPYDRWGFAFMPEAVDDRYLRYVIRRLSAYRNVWWALANEYDLLFAKGEPDWERYARIVGEEDPARHLLSIHNWRRFFDQTRPWITHSSIQRIDPYRTSEYTDEWRTAFGKPIVIDECAYEGDIDQGWGNITAEEMVRRFWEGAIRGGYVGHGETYLADNDVLWWSKGGELHGSSPARIAFLRHILEEAPGGLQPISLENGAPRGGIPGRYYLTYFGNNRPAFRHFLMAPGVEYEVDVIDTWAMEVSTLPGRYAGSFAIDLPARPFMAVRMRAIENEPSAAG